MSQRWLGLVGVLVLLSACGATPGATTTGTPSASLSTTELKYKILAAVGPDDYCDPDEYPVARVGGAQENATRLYPTIRSSGETYTTILGHLDFHEPLNDAQKLAVYSEWKQLNALRLSGSSPALFDQTFRSGPNSTTEEVSGSVSTGGEVHIDSRRANHINCPI